MLIRAVHSLLLLFVVLVALPSVPAHAASGGWTAITRELPARQNGVAAEVRPERFRAYALDRASLRSSLAGVPLERSGGQGRVVGIPGPRGVERFRVVESPVMEPGLAERHPDIKTYAGRGVDDPSASVRFDITPQGFHASVRTEEGTWYVDPSFRGDDRTHVAYWGRDLEDGGEIVERFPPIVPEGHEPRAARRTAPAGEEVPLRTYRLALISDPEYAAYHGPGLTGEELDEAVTAAKVTLMNRVNQIYNDDTAIRMVLVADNDKLNFNDDLIGFHGPDPSRCGGPCYPGADSAEPGEGQGTGEACDPQTITHNNVVADLLIGDANYDIGHIILGEPGGGVAFLGVVGYSDLKAGGCTGLETPTGDFFAVDYVAHEMGHQFAGNHTFNGTQGSCGGNKSDESVEPGSGTSVMAYAGICGQDDLQPHSDPYFSQRSLDEIEAHVADDGDEESTNEGWTITPSGNLSPAVTVPAPRTIPVRTPFTLTGGGSDADGDTLIWLWEENDAGSGEGTALTDNNKPDGPLFRIFGRHADISEEAALTYAPPGENVATPADATRTFPDPAQIASGNTNAATGSCPNVVLSDDGEMEPLPIRECYAEFLPTTERTMKFRLTARDLDPNGGGVNHAETVITVAGDAPFRVTSQGAPAGANGNTALPVTWDVAGTNAAPFNVSAVRISYSTDGGLTFPTVLAESTPNDGSANVTLPNTATTSGRVKVEAVGNYFFDVSRGNLTVTPSATTATTSGADGGGTATPTPVSNATLNGVLRPDLSRVPRRLRATRTRRVKLRLRCVSAGTFATPTRCRGTVRLYARVGGKQRRIGRRSFDFGLTETRTVTVRLTRAAYRRLRGRSLRASVRATVQSPGRGARTAAKQVRLVRRSR